MKKFTKEFKFKFTERDGLYFLILLVILVLAFGVGVIYTKRNLTPSHTYVSYEHKATDFNLVTPKIETPHSPGDVVYISRKDHYYHKRPCEDLDNDTGVYSIYIEDAKNLGYSPCPDCYSLSER